MTCVCGSQALEASTQPHWGISLCSLLLLEPAFAVSWVHVSCTTHVASNLPQLEATQCFDLATDLGMTQSIPSSAPSSAPYLLIVFIFSSHDGHRVVFSPALYSSARSVLLPSLMDCSLPCCLTLSFLICPPAACLVRPLAPMVWAVGGTVWTPEIFCFGGA